MDRKNNTLYAFILGVITFLSFPTLIYAQTSPTPTCNSTAPTDAPNLYQITPGQGSATLYFAPPSSTFTGFVISYGLDSNANTYNATLSQGATSGAVTYTVNALSPNTKYYFRVQAVNDCAGGGPWSSVLSTTTSSSGATAGTSGASGTASGTLKTPVTGPNDVIYFGLAALLLSFGGIGLFVKYK